MRYASRLPFLALAAVAIAACTSSSVNTAPVLRPFEWTVTDWHDSTHAPTATANFGQHTWVYITKQSVTLDTTKDSVARVMFRLAVDDCDGCEFYFPVTLSLPGGSPAAAPPPDPGSG